MDAKEECTLFDVNALLVSVEGDVSDAKTLVEAALFEIGKNVNKMRGHVARMSFPEILIDAANIHGLSNAIESQALVNSAEHLSRVAITKDKAAIEASLKDFEACLSQLELRLKEIGWR